MGKVLNCLAWIHCAGAAIQLLLAHEAVCYAWLIAAPEEVDPAYGFALKILAMALKNALLSWVFWRWVRRYFRQAKAKVE